MRTSPSSCPVSLSLSLLAGSLFFTFAACSSPEEMALPDGGDQQSDDLGTDSDAGTRPPRPPVGAPITAPMNTWTWVDFPDAVCDDGTPTGIGVSLTGSKNLLVFMNGGGACWSYLTCAGGFSTHGPFGKSQFDKASGQLKGSVLDRQAANPFADYNMVFVPYCTSDVHAGDKVTTYTSANGSNMMVMHHKGRANIAAYLKRLAATIPTPEKLVVSGSSAGGFGSAADYDLFRTYFPGSKSYLLDDSGPPFIGDAIPENLRTSWYDVWGLDQTFGAECPACKMDMSALVGVLGQKYPKDRMALLSYTQDSTIRQFFGFQSADKFQMNLYDLASKVLDPRPQFHYYFVTGTSHTFLGSPASTTAQGVPLWSWITQFATDDPAWTSTKP